VGNFLSRVCATGALIWALSCAAVATDAPPVIVGQPVSLTLDLTGTVQSRCGFAAAPAQDTTLSAVDTAGQIALPFKLDCNAPFAVKISSVNGALSHVGAVSAPPTFATSLDYIVALSVNTDLVPVSGRCAASTLSSQACSFAAGLSSGDGVGIGTDGALIVTWTPPAQKLVAGSYQDSLTVTVEVRT